MDLDRQAFDRRSLKAETGNDPGRCIELYFEANGMSPTHDSTH